MTILGCLEESMTTREGTTEKVNSGDEGKGGNQRISMCWNINRNNCNNSYNGNNNSNSDNEDKGKNGKNNKNNKYSPEDVSDVVRAYPTTSNTWLLPFCLGGDHYWLVVHGGGCFKSREVSSTYCKGCKDIAGIYARAQIFPLRGAPKTLFLSVWY